MASSCFGSMKELGGSTGRDGCDDARKTGMFEDLDRYIKAFEAISRNFKTITGLRNYEQYSNEDGLQTFFENASLFIERETGL